MRMLVTIADALIALARPVVFALIVLATVLCLLDWLVRTRRVNPFGALARFTRRVADPIITPMERRIVRAGGTPASAPWWTLVAVTLGGLALLALLGFLRDALVNMYYSLSNGPKGIVRLLVSWTFAVLQVAIIVRVITSWVGGTYSAVGRLAFKLTEWLLRPLRRLIPGFGGIDITPIVGWLVLRIVQSVVRRTL
ncbi:MAG TPA: YggT family protein [Gemmatimonadaceae bacterium]|nr:YggT family protein [Gemmatimonadaceae bacterium]